MEHRAAGVASRALELALRGESFQVKDIQRMLSDAPSRQTCYRVLRQLAADDWIYQNGKTWYPDLKAKGLRGDGENDPDDGDGFSISADDVF